MNYINYKGYYLNIFYDDTLERYYFDIDDDQINTIYSSINKIMCKTKENAIIKAKKFIDKEMI